MQVYLKLQSSCLLFSDESSQCDSASVNATSAVGMGMGHKHKEEHSDEDEIWNGMETVGGRRKRTKRELLTSIMRLINLTVVTYTIGTKNSESHAQNKIPRTS